jgi:hypothetical protein
MNWAFISAFSSAQAFVKYRTGGLGVHVFCLVTLHLCGRILQKYPELQGLAHADDGSIIGPLSKVLGSSQN